MKFYETHFEEYITEVNKVNLHPKLEKIYDKFPKTINEFKNLIFFGPSGTGKYSQMLKSIQKYSCSDLKYERKNLQRSLKVIAFIYNQNKMCNFGANFRFTKV